MILDNQYLRDTLTEGKYPKRIPIENLTILLFITTIMIIGIFTVSGIDLFKTLAITLAITFYHFAMRLFIGFIYHAKFNNSIFIFPDNSVCVVWCNRSIY